MVDDTTLVGLFSDPVSGTGLSSCSPANVGTTIGNARLGMVSYIHHNYCGYTPFPKGMCIIYICMPTPTYAH